MITRSDKHVDGCLFRMVMNRTNGLGSLYGGNIRYYLFDKPYFLLNNNHISFTITTIFPLYNEHILFIITTTYSS